MRNKILLLILPICLFIFGLNSAKADSYFSVKPSEYDLSNYILMSENFGYNSTQKVYISKNMDSICIHQTFGQNDISCVNYDEEFKYFYIFGMKSSYDTYIITSKFKNAISIRYGDFAGYYSLSPTTVNNDISLYYSNKFDVGFGYFSYYNSGDVFNTHNINKNIWSYSPSDSSNTYLTNDTISTNNNNYFLDKNGEIFITPTIDISLKEYIYGEKLNINETGDSTNIKGAKMEVSFSSFNTDKYKYHYKINNSNWIDITSVTDNKSLIEVNENGTFIVEITDLEDNYIASSTFVITGLTTLEGLKEDGDYILKDDNNNNLNYTHRLKIPISYFKNSSEGWKNYKFYFMSKDIENKESNVYVTLEDNGSHTREFKFNVLLAENSNNLDDLDMLNKKVNAESYDLYEKNYKYNFENLKYYTKLPYYKTIVNDSPSNINLLVINTESLSNSYYLDANQYHEGKTLNISDFSTRYVVIYYNARLYEDNGTLGGYYEDVYNDNDIGLSFAEYIKSSINYFISPIKEIFKIISYFFNSLPYQIRYMLIAIFTLIVTLILFKFLI